MKLIFQANDRQRAPVNRAEPVEWLFDLGRPNSPAAGSQRPIGERFNLSVTKGEGGLKEWLPSPAYTCTNIQLLTKDKDLFILILT